MKAGLEPIESKDSLILILGTMPGDYSLNKQQYYSHRDSQFWQIMFALFERPVSPVYTERINLLNEHRIALWDVIGFCKREGNGVSKITEETANDFDTFYQSHPNIKHVVFVSQMAARYYDKHIGRKAERTYYILPSPSRANAWQSIKEKISKWELLLQLLNRY